MSHYHAAIAAEAAYDAAVSREHAALADNSRHVDEYIARSSAAWSALRAAIDVLSEDERASGREQGRNW